MGMQGVGWVAMDFVYDVVRSAISEMACRAGGAGQSRGIGDGCKWCALNDGAVVRCEWVHTSAQSGRLFAYTSLICVEQVSVVACT